MLRHRWWHRGLTIFITASLIAGTLFGLSLRVSTKTTKGLVSISLPATTHAEDYSQNYSSVPYYIGGGQYSLDSLIRAPYFTDDQGIKQQIDNTLVPAIAPWNWEMTEADYHIRVKEDFTAGQIIEYEVGSETVQFQPMALEWTNDLDQIQPVGMPVNVAPVINNDTIMWNDGYGSGIDFEWKCSDFRLLKTLTVSGLNDLPPPQQYVIDGSNPVLRLNLIFAPSKNLDIYVNGQLWDQKVKVQTFDEIEFRQGEDILWMFAPLMYWDSGDSQGQSVATLEKRGNKLYISIRVPYSWLQTAQYPIFIDADVTINGNIHGLAFLGHRRGGIFWTSTTVGYVVYISAAADLEYEKTSDGGATWGAAQTVAADTYFFDSWADWQTDGDAGTKIHMAYINFTTEKLAYQSLDTSSDSLSGEIGVVNGTAVASSTSPQYSEISITKSRGGKLGVASRYYDGTQQEGLWTSPDGTTWTGKASPFESADWDRIQIYPANLADSDDIWASYWDSSADEISLKTFDDSGNSWSAGTSISGSMVDSSNYMQMGGAIRHSDGHLIFAAWNLYDNAAADLKVWDITDEGTITAKTNILTDTSEAFQASILIDQNTDNIYANYLNGVSAGSNERVQVNISLDGGTSWEGETRIDQTQDDHRWISAGAVNPAWGGLVLTVWFNDDLNDLLCNPVTGVELPAAGGEPDISVAPISYDFGVVAESTTPYTATNYFTITNSSSMQTDQTIGVTTSSWSGGVGWTHSDTATPGANQAGLLANKEGTWGAGDVIVKYNTPNYIAEDQPASTDYGFGLKLVAPTSFSDGVEKTIIVRVSAVAG